MAYLREADLRAVGARETLIVKSAGRDILRESLAAKNNFDIFLSHAMVDRDLVRGAVEVLRNVGLTAYVDWLVDPQLNRADVTQKTADTLRSRMKQCKMLFYLWSESASDSRWMPWELGYFDALKRHVAIVPIVKTSDASFKGTEFVGLYPTVDFPQIGSKFLPKINGVDPVSWTRGQATIDRLIGMRLRD